MPTYEKNLPAARRDSPSALGSAWPGLVESLGNGVLLLDTRGNILYTNREAQRLLMRRASALHGQPFGYLLRQGEPTEFDIVGADGTTRVIEIRAVPVGFSDGEGWVASLHDVTERARRRDRLREDAAGAGIPGGTTDLGTRDLLTGLLNAQGLAAHFRERLRDDDRPHGRFTVLAICLEDLKPINDAFGHEVGDRLVRRVAERLAREASATHPAARLGGQEFLLLAPNLRGATGLATKLLSELSQISLYARAEQIPAHCGIVVMDVAHPGSVSARQLQGIAAFARRMLDARSSDTVVVAPPQSLEPDSSSLTLGDLGPGFPDNVHLYPLAQPIAAVDTGAVSAFEWLTRPQAESLTATDFFRLAADGSNLLATNLRCLALCVREAATLGNDALHYFNVAAEALLESPNAVLTAMPSRSLGRAPRIEVSMPHINGPLTALPALARQVREAGCDLVLKHFVPGAHAVEAARLLKPVAVMLDGDLLRQSRARPDAVDMLRNAIAPLREWPCDIIATSVEDAEDADLVRRAGVTAAQGYFYGRPQPAGHWRARREHR